MNKNERRVDLMVEDFSVGVWVIGGGDQEGLPHLSKYWDMDKYWQTWTNIDKNWQIWTNIDKYWQILTNMDKYWQTWTNIDKNWQILTNMDNYWQILTNIDKYWQILTNIDKYWQKWTNIDSGIKSLATLEFKVEGQILNVITEGGPRGQATKKDLTNNLVSFIKSFS